MKTNRLARVASIFSQALEKAPKDQQAFIEAQTEDEEVRAQVLRMLAAHEQTTSFVHTAGGLEDLASLNDGDVVGAWAITGKLGAGGMGEVYEAERSDGHFEQSAALKLIASSDPKLWERFARERQILADLEHPGISRLIDGGVADDGKPFLVMERIEGAQLGEALADGKFNERAKLELFCELCEAVSFAHSRLVLHRDIKPSNILLTEDGRIKLVDFGIAGLLASPVKTEGSLYTKGYAAPEQLAGENARVQTDVFSLGLTFHEMLTGDLPKRLGDGSHAIDPATVDLAGELRAIFDRATMVQPNDRYETVQAFAGDVEAYLTDHPVSALPQTRGYMGRKFVSRNKTPVMLASALVLALFAGLGAVSWFAIETNRAYELEQIARLDAEERARFANTSNSLFAEATGQAIAAQDQGEVDLLQLLNDKRDEAIGWLSEDPSDEDARGRLYALSTLHKQRGDVKAMLESLRPIYDATDQLDRATVMGLRTYGYYSGMAGDTDTAEAAFERFEALVEQDLARYEFERVEMLSLRADFDPDPDQIRSAIDELVVYARSGKSGSTNEKNDAVHLLNRAGQLANRIDDPEAALGYLEEAFAINASITEAKATPDAFLLFGLVAVTTSLGQFEAALEHSEKAVSEARVLFGPSVGLAKRLQNRGSILLELDRAGEAEQAFAEAAELHGRFGAPNGQEEVEAQMSIFIARARKGNIQDALSEAERFAGHQAGQLADNPFANYQANIALGQLQELAGDVSAARARYQDALNAAKGAASRPDYIAKAEAALKQLEQ